MKYWGILDFIPWKVIIYLITLSFLPTNIAFVLCFDHDKVWSFSITILFYQNGDRGWEKSMSLIWKAIWVFINHFPISGIISRYREFEFPISGIRIPDIGKWFPDIGNSNFGYREIWNWFPISRNESHFSISRNDFPISGNDFPISGNQQNYRYREMISRYREIRQRRRTTPSSVRHRWWVRWLQSFRPGLSRSAPSPSAPMQYTPYFC